MKMYRASRYRCRVCYRNFKKFVIFEGHLSFHRKCRENIGHYMQCYLCQQKFHNFAALSYHKKQFHKLDWTNKPSSTSTRPCDIVADNNQIIDSNNVSELSGTHHGRHDKIIGKLAVEEAMPTCTSEEPKTMNFSSNVRGKRFKTEFHLNEGSTTHSIAIATRSSRINRIDSPQPSSQKDVDSKEGIAKFELMQNNRANVIEKVQ